jgi:hypothetical protein
MTSSDLLREAAGALRELGDGAHGPAETTRARVLQQVAERRRRKQRIGAALLSLACVSMGSTAWAAATGRLPAVWRLVTGAFQRDTHETAPPIATHGTARPTPPPIAPAPTIAPSPMMVAPAAPATRAPREKAVRAEIRRPQSPAPTAPVAAPVPARDPQDTLFKAAYQAHFVARDPSAALDGWDRYLAAAPDGRYALEASYNRALCLVRLGRRADAIAALRPFVDGTAGDYRRREATRLVELLSAADR